MPAAGAAGGGGKEVYVSAAWPEQRWKLLLVPAGAAGTTSCKKIGLASLKAVQY